MRVAHGLVVASLLVCVACSRSETGAGPDLAASSAGARALPAPRSATAPSALASPSASPSASGDAGFACGEKGLPDCPLQAWMKKVANPPMLDKDAPAIADAFDKMVPLAPSGYPHWVSIAKDGAKAARAGDIDAARAACRGCHDQYKTKYRAELRARSL